MERARVISHEGKQIVYVDFAHCSAAETLQVIAEGTPLIRNQDPKSALILTDFTSSTTDPSLLSSLRDFVAGFGPYEKASAIVGLNRVAQVFFAIIMEFIGREIPIFPDANQAVTWLAAQ